MAQVTTITFFRFDRPVTRVWAFFMMQFARAPLRKVEGQERFFLMGTGKEGFSPWPDFSVYALVQIWNSKEQCDYFFNTSSLYAAYVRRCSEVLRFYMKNIEAKGMWNGINPFQPSEELDPNNPLIAVITRATIRTRLQLKFWRAVPATQRAVFDSEGLRFTKGIGEIPFRNMATFSLWSSMSDMESFAYRKDAHRGAIKQTRKLNWYSEELFSRFQPYAVVGVWDGTTITLSD